MGEIILTKKGNLFSSINYYFGELDIKHKQEYIEY